MAAIALIVGTLSSPNEGAGTSKLQKASLGRDKKQKIGAENLLKTAHDLAYSSKSYKSTV